MCLWQLFLPGLLCRKRVSPSMVSSSNELHANTYVIDSESPAELARLLSQDRFFIRSLKLLPEIPEFSRFRTALDIGCGPGGWALEMAKMYPSLQVTAIDISNRVVEFARAQAESQQIHNVNFMHGSAFDLSSFPDDSFDFINGRFLVGFMPYESWPQLALACQRILRPGGILCLTEAEIPITSGPISQQFFASVAEALFRKQYGRSHAMTQVTVSLQPALRQAGYKDIKHCMYQLEFSYDTDEYEPNCQNIVALVSLMKPFILAMQVLDEAEYDEMQAGILADLYGEKFLGQWFVLRTWGRKPLK
jgi:ubiquinone/menaquinone biosynthesis C-methylase UbiE